MGALDRVLVCFGRGGDGSTTDRDGLVITGPEEIVMDTSGALGVGFDANSVIVCFVWVVYAV